MAVISQVNLSQTPVHLENVKKYTSFVDSF